MIIYASFITPRLRYVGNFICNLLTGADAQFVTDVNEFVSYTGIKINYTNTKILPDEFWLRPHTLLFEKNISQQEITVTERDGVKSFFQTEGDFYFDIFAATFYLLSRYEEYLPHEKDMYGRYPHVNSLAFRESFLEQPLVNIWVEKFKTVLQERFSEFTFEQHKFSFLPTYDIDEAFSFKYKTWQRSAGGAFRDLLKGNLKRFAQRRNVLNNNETDPFDSYSWLNDLHRPYSFQPIYFFLTAVKNGKYDKNNLPSEIAVQTLMKRIAEQYPLGIHPSWQSGDNHSLMSTEKKTLEDIVKLKVTQSRQHYIRFELPNTYRYLMEAGIQQDYSMGYGSINGFRASVAVPFYWYDLNVEQVTDLKIFPFCYMEANSFYEQKQTAEQSFEELMHYYNEVKNVNGMFITIWHNTFLGTDEKFKGWRDVYASFINNIMH